MTKRIALIATLITSALALIVAIGALTLAVKAADVQVAGAAEVGTSSTYVERPATSSCVTTSGRQCGPVAITRYAIAQATTLTASTVRGALFAQIYADWCGGTVEDAAGHAGGPYVTHCDN